MRAVRTGLPGDLRQDTHVPSSPFGQATKMNWERETSFANSVVHTLLMDDKCSACVSFSVIQEVNPGKLVKR